jgi:hypothetical protein
LVRSDIPFFALMTLPLWWRNDQMVSNGKLHEFNHTSLSVRRE